MNRKHSQSARPPKIRGTASVFCDEAGFTGNNLLDSEQEVFALAGVAMDADRAQEVVERTVTDFKLQGQELKGSRMLKTDQGRRAITSVLKGCAQNVRLVAHLKKFALACKFFEYVFEPALAEQNSIFYGCGFHLFIGNFLWMMLRARDASAESIFEEFSKFARDGSAEALEKLFPSGGLVVNLESDPLAAISLFAMINRSAIQAEIDSIHSDRSTPSWILDLTTTSLFSVLRYWGEAYDDLDVLCDKSKPIETETEILKAMIGRRDHFRMNVFGKETQFTFNLVREPRLVNSRLYPGVQIADVFAAAVARGWQQVFRGRAHSAEREWLDLTRECHLEDNIWPDLELIDLRKRNGFVNTLVLLELAQRSVKKENLFRGMPEFIATAHAGFSHYRKNLDGRRGTRRRKF
jgi:Protein of unknown function (DUF3800)